MPDYFSAIRHESQRVRYRKQLNAILASKAFDPQEARDKVVEVEAFLTLIQSHGYYANEVTRLVARVRRRIDERTNPVRRDAKSRMYAFLCCVPVSTG